MKTTTCTFLLLATILIAASVVSLVDARQITEDSFFGMPWFGGNDFPGWEGPYGGDEWKNFMHPSIVCKEKGPCFNKKLTCPTKCFHSIEGKGKHASGGGCAFDCTKCKASC